MTGGMVPKIFRDLTEPWQHLALRSSAPFRFRQSRPLRTSISQDISHNRSISAREKWNRKSVVLEAEKASRDHDCRRGLLHSAGTEERITFSIATRRSEKTDQIISEPSQRKRGEDYWGRVPHRV